jgi:hypothetical protein
MLICLCQADEAHTVKSGSPRIHPDPIPLPNALVTMQCIKTGAPTMVGASDYERNCDIYMCVHCGARVAYL